MRKLAIYPEDYRMLGCTRHHTKRLIIKHRIEWPRAYQPKTATADGVGHG